MFRNPMTALYREPLVGLICCHFVQGCNDVPNQFIPLPMRFGCICHHGVCFDLLVRFQCYEHPLLQVPRINYLLLVSQGE